MIESIKKDIQEDKNSLENPFFKKWSTTHATVPFSQININHYKPAVLAGIQQENEEIEKITNSTETPTWSNTIYALENCGDSLEKVTTVLMNLLSAESSDKLEAIAEDLSAKLSEHSSDIWMNQALFERVKIVWSHRNVLKGEELRSTENLYNSFIRSGANLPNDKKNRLREINQRIDALQLKFSSNLLKATNEFELLITQKELLEGLPQNQIDEAHNLAILHHKEGWAFSLKATSYVPFMTYAKDRQLRQQMYMAYNTRCNTNDKNDNRDIVKQIVNLRFEKSQLLGYKCYADFILERRMAANRTNVYQLLNDLLISCKEQAIEETKEIENLAKQTEGNTFTIQPWDFGYWSNQYKKLKHNLDDEMLRPYLELDKVVKGIFGLATTLYGITFKINNNIEVYHPDVKAYEVYDSNKSFLAILYLDIFPREGKKSGAWMTNYKEQWINDNHTNDRPHVSITTNLTRPGKNCPSLLTLDEVETLLHEFGHTLHGMFANTRLKSMSGTNVYWDFVELPSQFMENYAIEKDFLNTFAQHYQTNESMPESLIKKIKESRNFNAAYGCLRQVSFGLLDMAFHSLETPLTDENIENFEQKAWKEAQILPHIKGTCMAVQFSHIMAGGYAAGYYSYKWAEVMDADAFSLFKETGIFNKITAASFRDHILSKGGSEDPMSLYVKFRGRKPTIKALLERSGLSK